MLTQSIRKRRGHSITNLPVLGLDIARKAVPVGESLQGDDLGNGTGEVVGGISACQPFNHRSSRQSFTLHPIAIALSPSLDPASVRNPLIHPSHSTADLSIPLPLSFTTSPTYLRPRTLPHCHDPVLFWVKAHAHFAHGLGVSHGGWEVALPVQPSKQPLPVVVPLLCVGQAPGDQIYLPLVGQAHLRANQGIGKRVVVVSLLAHIFPVAAMLDNGVG